MRQDPIIEHFELMTNVVKYLQLVDAELWVTDYSNPGSFGSWTIIFRLKGERYRLLYDGRDRRLFLATESQEVTSGYFPTRWDERYSAEVSENHGLQFERQIQGLLQQIPIKN